MSVEEQSCLEPPGAAREPWVRVAGGVRFKKKQGLGGQVEGHTKTQTGQAVLLFKASFLAEIQWQM